MIQNVIILVAGMLPYQSHCSNADVNLSVFELEQGIVFVNTDNVDAILVSIKSSVFVDNLVFLLQIELCSIGQDEKHAIFVDKERPVP